MNIKKLILVIALLAMALTSCDNDNVQKKIKDTSTVQNPISDSAWQVLCESTTTDSELWKQIGETCLSKGYQGHAPF